MLLTQTRGTWLGNASRTYLPIPAATLKSNEMLCAIECVESNRFPLTSTVVNFFEISDSADSLHEVKSLFTSLFFDISRTEMLVLQLWHHVLFPWVNEAFSSFVQGLFGHSVSFALSLFCVKCFASAPRVGAFAWSIVAS